MKWADKYRSSLFSTCVHILSSHTHLVTVSDAFTVQLLSGSQFRIALVPITETESHSLTEWFCEPQNKVNGKCPKHSAVTQPCICDKVWRWEGFNWPSRYEAQRSPFREREAQHGRHLRLSILVSLLNAQWCWGINFTVPTVTQNVFFQLSRLLKSNSKPLAHTFSAFWVPCYRFVLCHSDPL